jgi:hypothetical protein
MNPGKKLIRNTVFGLWGTAALFVGLNRLNATPSGTEGGGSFLTMGLRQDQEPERNSEIDLATARDFTRISVRGRFSVEVVGSQSYKVTLTPAAGQSPEIHAYQKDGVLHVDGGEPEGELQGELRFEVPTLARIDATAPRITVRGLKVPEFSLYMHRGGAALLEENQVQHWHMFSSQALELQVDDATFAAGTMESKGAIVIRRAP